jgi:hypothetical protein
MVLPRCYLSQERLKFQVPKVPHKRVPLQAWSTRRSVVYSLNRADTEWPVQWFYRLAVPSPDPQRNKTGHDAQKDRSPQNLTPHRVLAVFDSRESIMSNRYCIPNNLDNWKWPRHLNPHYPEVKAASAAWARSFGAFSPKAQDAYDRCDFSMIYHILYKPT